MLKREMILNKNYLFFSDLHITKKDLPECKAVLGEIIDLCDSHQITHIFNLGDTFDNLHPTSCEFDLFSDFITALNRPITILAAQSHESEDSTNSIVNHFSILNKNVTIVKEYKENDLYCGHFIVNQSKNNYGGTVDASTLKKYKYVILGHEHIPEDIGNIYQLGSVRYVDFGDNGAIPKRVAIIDEEGLKFVNLKSPIPMQDIYLATKQGIEVPKQESPRRGRPKRMQISPSETQKTDTFEGISRLLPYLDSLDPKNKIRIIFLDFTSWLAFRPYYDKYSDKFILFTDRKDYTITIKENKIDDKNQTLKQSLEAYLKENNVSSSIQEILLKEIE